MSGLHILPIRTAGAAENMAVDFLLLRRYPDNAPRFRHYHWRSPALTFGYSQKIADVRRELAMIGAEGVDLCRRPTGGGIVDHRDDWTYTLVIPRGHPLEEMRAQQSYRAVHEALARALQGQGIPAQLQTSVPEGPAGICFARAELADVVRTDTKAKLAGAAQKRNKHGLLFQGSIARAAAGASVDWDRFLEDFSSQVAVALGGAPEPRPWPDTDDDELSALAELYSSAEWNEQR